MMEASLQPPTTSNKNTATLATDINSYYGPTVGDGEEDLDDPWDDHHESELVDERIYSTANSNSNLNHDDLFVEGGGVVSQGEGEDDTDGEDDSEMEDKFHCRPRYQHTRVEVSWKSWL